MHVILHPLCLYNAVTCPRLQDGDCFFTRLLKIDVVSKTSQEWKEEGTYPGEPIFVPHPEASQEDQGVLLSVVLAGLFCICDILVSFAPCCVCNVLVAFVPKFCESMREGCCMLLSNKSAECQYHRVLCIVSKHLLKCGMLPGKLFV